MDIVLEEQAEGNRIDKLLERCALVQLDLAGRCGLIDLIVLGNCRRNDAGFGVLHEEGKLAVIGFIRRSKGIYPFAVCRIGQAELVARFCRDNKVFIDPVVGIYLILAAVSRIFHDTRRNAARLCERVVADGHAVAGESKCGEADSNVFADLDAVKGRNTVYKRQHITVDHAHKRRRSVDCGGVFAVVLFILDLEVGNRQFLGRDTCRSVCRLSRQHIVCRIVSGKGKVVERDRLAAADVFVVIGSLTGDDINLVAVDQSVECALFRNLGIGAAVIDLGGLDCRIHDLDFLDRDIRSYSIGLCSQLIVCRSITFKRKTGEHYRLALADILIVVGSFTGCHLEVFAVVVDGRRSCVRDSRVGRAVVDSACLNFGTDYCNLLYRNIGCNTCRLCDQLVVSCLRTREFKACECNCLARTDILIIVGCGTCNDREVLAVIIVGQRSCICDLCFGRAVINLGAFHGRTVDCNFLHGDIGSRACRLCDQLVVACRRAGKLKSGKGYRLIGTDILVVVGCLSDYDCEVISVIVYRQCSCICNGRIRRTVIGLISHLNIRDRNLSGLDFKLHR